MRWWLKLIAALMLVVLLLTLGWGMVRGIIGLLKGMDLDFSEPDPMFAQETVLPTRPPELDAQGSVPERLTLDDLPPIEGALVDKTAEQLIQEAQQKANS